jgi:hypothetical protein
MLVPLGICYRNPSIEIAPPDVYVTKLCAKQAEIIKNNEKENVRNIGQGEKKTYRKYKMLKLGGGHVYDLSSA